jgi:hypothetical protein
MKINPRFIQRSCVEGNKIDLRQADAVIKYQPDIIVFELPQDSKEPSKIFNRYSCKNKPVEKVDEIIKNLKKASKKYPYAASDIIIWENIKKLWGQGINTQIYNIDAPTRVRRSFNLFKKPISAEYPAVRRDWLFWVYLYLREVHMTKNMQMILHKYPNNKNLTILVCVQSIHWDHTTFLLTNPSKKEIWKYYFGRFKELKPNKDIENKIKERSRILNYYWKKVQKFY